MSTTIYYFSATGNSLKVARDIADRLGKAAIISISAMKNTKLDFSSETIGIVFPVYIWGIPAIVSRFIENIGATSPQKYIFAIATCKSQPGGALNQLNKKLKKHGLLLSAGFNVKMPGNHIVYYETDSVESQNEKFKAWEKRLSEIVTLIKNHNMCKIESGSLIKRILGTGILHRLITKTFPESDKRFWTDSNCTGCGTCSNVCPVKNIEIVDHKPFWLHRCEQCVACLNLCPNQAIQYMKTTIGKKRYKNPFVELKDLMNELIY